MYRDDNPFRPNEPLDALPADFDPDADESRSSPRGYWGLVAGLVVVGLIWVALLPSFAHVTRVAAVLVAVAVILRPCLRRVGKKDWALAGFWVTAGAVLAALAWWMVPTTAGLSLWTAGQEADRQAAALEGLSADDLKAFQEGRAARQHLLSQFPRFGSRIEAAERAWGERAVRAAAAEVEKVPAGDFARYREGRPAREALRQEFGTSQPPLNEAEHAWVEQSVTAVVVAAVPLLKTDPLQASLRLRQAADDVAACGPFGAAQDRLLTARRQAVAAGLEAAKRQARTLLGADRVRAAAEAAQRMQADFGAEVAAVGLEAEFGQLRQDYEFLADLARQAGKREPQ